LFVRTDRAPNLGGLSRTSEIFGVRQLLLPNMCFVQDKEFQGLSVSAHKWLPMDEVPVNQLLNYLAEQRNRHGYKLVGVEQSTGSVCLTRFEFPEKSLLVLG
jgi:tRNA guanosine-2'-O-methyltransferase